MEIEENKKEDTNGGWGDFAEGCCSGAPLETILVIILCLFSFGNIFKAHKVYNFGELKNGYVISKEVIRHYGYGGGGTNEYLVHIDVLGKPLELPNHEDIQEHTNIDFFIYKNNPDYFVYTGSNKREWKPILYACLNIYNKIFLIIFVIISTIILLYQYLKVIIRIYRTALIDNKITGKHNALLTTLIHSLILFLGFVFSIYVGIVIFNNISKNEDIYISLAGFYMVASLLFVFLTPFILQNIFNLFHQGKKIFVKTIINILLIFSILNAIAGVLGTLLNDDPSDFTPLGVLQIIRDHWSIILGA